jgi:hypothetical protein
VLGYEEGSMKIQLKWLMSYFAYSQQFEPKLDRIVNISNWRFQTKEQRVGDERTAVTGIQIEREYIAETKDLPDHGEISMQELKKESHAGARRVNKEGFQEIIRPFLDTVIVISKTHLDIKENPLKCINETEVQEKLIQNGYVLKKTGVSGIHAILNVLPSDMDIVPSFQFFAKHLLSAKAKVKKEFSRIVGWMEKGFGQEDDYDRYICYWIAFNGLYNMVWEEKYGNRKATELDKFGYLIEELFSDPSSTSQFVENLRDEFKIHIRRISHLNLLSGTGNTNWSECLKRLEEKKDTSSDFIRMLVNCFYSARKKLFHGDLSVSQREEVIVVCVPILKEVTLQCLKRSLLGDIWS